MAHEASHSAGERKRPRGMKPISKKAMASHRAKQKAYMDKVYKYSPIDFGVRAVKKHGKKVAKKFGNMLSFGQPFK